MEVRLNMHNTYISRHVFEMHVCAQIKTLNQSLQSTTWYQNESISICPCLGGFGRGLHLKTACLRRNHYRNMVCLRVQSGCSKERLFWPQPSCCISCTAVGTSHFRASRSEYNWLNYRQNEATCFLMNIHQRALTQSCLFEDLIGYVSEHVSSQTIWRKQGLHGSPGDRRSA